MAEDKNLNQAELRSTFGRLLPEGRKNDEQLDEVSGGLRCQDSIYHEGVDE